MCIGLGQMVVAQQGRDVLATGLALCAVTDHHHMRNDQWRLHGFWRAGMYFVVQRSAAGMLGNLKLGRHRREWVQQKESPYFGSEKKRHQEVPFLENQAPDGRLWPCGKLLLDEGLFPFVLDGR